MILVTGGAGYIGSHVCIELLHSNIDIIIVDNFSNSHPSTIQRIEALTGKNIIHYDVDILNKNALDNIFLAHSIHAVVHLAGFKSVSESIAYPLQYYHNNVIGTLTLLEAMAKHRVKQMVFSSSATVYGINNHPPYNENMPIGTCTNTYGQTKAAIENVLQDLAASDPSWHICILRYFNPIGAHTSGKVGEHPRNEAGNLCPIISQVASGIRDAVSIFGNDYPTPDGTCIRDYIHICDLARGHTDALQHIQSTAGICTYNLGTGKGTSVLEFIHAYEDVVGQPIPYRITNRRSGDLAIAFADVSKANNELGWKAKHDIRQMCEDAWRWQCIQSQITND